MSLARKSSLQEAAFAVNSNACAGVTPNAALNVTRPCIVGSSEPAVQIERVRADHCSRSRHRSIVDVGDASFLHKPRRPYSPIFVGKIELPS